MGPAVRRTGPALIEELRREPESFAFFQAVRLLELHAAARPAADRGPESRAIGYDVDPDREALRFRVQPSLGFPAGAVQGLAPGEEGAPPTVRVNLLGLVGSGGVLPQHYTELIVRRLQLRDTSLRDFLDLFHHRALSLFFRAWRKYRLPFAHEHAARSGRDPDPFATSLAALVGLGTGGLRGRQSIDDRAWLFYSGQFARRTRTAADLQSMLGDYLGLPVRVEQFVGRWLELEPAQRSSILGRGQRPDERHRLGGGFVLGERVWDVQSGIRLHVGPMDYERFEDLLPGTDGARALADLVRSYVGPTLRYEVNLILHPEQVRPTRLGGDELPAARLGRSAWMACSPSGRPACEVSISLDRV